MLKFEFVTSYLGLRDGEYHYYEDEDYGNYDEEAEEEEEGGEEQEEEGGGGGDYLNDDAIVEAYRAAVKGKFWYVLRLSIETPSLMTCCFCREH